MLFCTVLYIVLTIFSRIFVSCILVQVTSCHNPDYMILPLWHRFVYDPEAAGDGMSTVSRRCHSRVDCVGASKGLFCGLLVLVASLICLILFFVLVNRSELKMLAIYLADCSHCGIMFFSIIAIFIGFVR